MYVYLHLKFKKLEFENYGKFGGKTSENLIYSAADEMTRTV
jgi:hypothetical protein